MTDNYKNAQSADPSPATTLAAPLAAGGLLAQVLIGAKPTSWPATPYRMTIYDATNGDEIVRVSDDTSWPDLTLSARSVEGADVNHAAGCGVDPSVVSVGAVEDIATGKAAAAVSGHVAAVDPHADRAYADAGDAAVAAAAGSALSAHVGATDPHGDRAYADTLATSARAIARLATAAALPACTFSSGAGTLTGNANGALSVDGVAVVVGNRILVKNQAAGAQNWIYDVTQAGDSTHPFILTRAAPFNSAAKMPPSIAFNISEGTQADTTWMLTTDATITLGTTAVTFSQMGPNASGVFSKVAQFINGALAACGIQIGGANYGFIRTGGNAIQTVINGAARFAVAASLVQVIGAKFTTAQAVAESQKLVAADPYNVLTTDPPFIVINVAPCDVNLPDLDVATTSITAGTKLKFKDGTISASAANPITLNSTSASGTDPLNLGIDNGQKQFVTIAKPGGTVILEAVIDQINGNYWAVIEPDIRIARTVAADFQGYGFGNVGASRTLLASYTLEPGIIYDPGDTLGGGSLEIEMFGLFAANIHTKRIEIEFDAGAGAVTMLDTGFMASSGELFRMKGRLHCPLDGGSAASAIMQLDTPTLKKMGVLTPDSGNFEYDAADFSVAQTINVYGTATSDDDILLGSFMCNADVPRS